MTEKIKVTRTRNFSAHHILIGAANAALQDAESKRPGWFISELMAITMSGLALEAICNAFGKRIREDWEEFESLNPIAKLILITENIGIKINYGIEPWGTSKWLYKFRNKIAHAKPEIVNVTYVWSREEYDKKEFEWPASKLESQISLENARRAVKCVEDIKLILFEKIDIDDKTGLYSDSYSGVAGIFEEDG
jgi:hypothetical protein